MKEHKRPNLDICFIQVSLISKLSFAAINLLISRWVVLQPQPRLCWVFNTFWRASDSLISNHRLKTSHTNVLNFVTENEWFLRWLPFPSDLWTCRTWVIGIMSAITKVPENDHSVNCRNSVCSRNSPQPCLDPPKSKWHDGQRRINEAVLGKIQPFERCYELAAVFRLATWLCE